ncbi:hypothetical protein [Erysipelatoclostridium sp. AM42-17]|uniref:hypothetical protein n=1 Tax=Erysipelatoclostridium sp. AM42-17 TaxID=2293102 RepID=UPI000E4A0C85|nr:hypothetical protein [Erysipelatoclostridium sp. AM42-17]RHS91574.1 hypothetical protein DW911_09985 [Erysipelatoclostridium sp. AM42-17]
MKGKNRGRDIDFLSVYYAKESTNTINFEKIKPWILPIVLVVLFAGSTGYFALNNHSMQKDVDSLNDKLQALIVQNAKQTDTEKETTLANLQKELKTSQAISDNLSSYPQITKQMPDQIQSVSKDLTIKSVSFTQENGNIVLSVESNRVDGCQNAVRQLKETGLFDDVNYTGYSQSGGVSEQTQNVTDPTTGEVTTQTTTTQTPIVYSSTITCVLQGGKTNGQN